MSRIAWLWLVGAMVVALVALGPGFTWAAGLTSSVGTLAANAQQPPASGGDEDDDDGDDDDDVGGGGDRAFCGSMVQPSTPMVRSTKAVRVNRKRVAAVRVTGLANQDSTVTVKLRRKGKRLARKSVELAAGESKLVKVKLSRKAFLKLRDRRQVKAIVTAGNAAAPPESGACFVPGKLDFDFDASSGPLGENPTGTFLWEVLPHHFEGQVTCLQVTGNRASVGGIITASPNPAAIGRGLAFTVVDNTAGAPDLISLPAPFQIFPDDLPAPPAANTPACGDTQQPTNPVTGDIVVQDNIAGGGDDEDEDDDEDEVDDDGDDGDDDGDDN